MDIIEITDPTDKAIHSITDLYGDIVCKEITLENGETDFITVCTGYDCDRCRLSSTFNCDTVLAFLAGRGYTFEQIQEWLDKNQIRPKIGEPDFD